MDGVCAQVDYAVSDDELRSHFQGCGTIARVTIRKDKVTQKPLGCVCVHVYCLFIILPLFF